MIVIATMEHVAREFTNALSERLCFVTNGGGAPAGKRAMIVIALVNESPARKRRFGRAILPCDGRRIATAKRLRGSGDSIPSGVWGSAPRSCPKYHAKSTGRGMGEPLRARLRRGAPAGNRAMIVIATMEHVAREFTNALSARLCLVTDGGGAPTRLRRGSPRRQSRTVCECVIERAAREFTNALGARFHFVTDADLWDAFRQRPKALNAAPSTTKSARNVPKYANLTIICYL